MVVPPHEDGGAPGRGDHRGRHSTRVMTRAELSREIEQRIKNLPTLPSVVAEVTRLIADPSSSAADFENVLGADPVLLARVLKLVNAPFFGLAHKVTAVRQAVAILGYNSLKALVTATATSHLLAAPLPMYGFDSGGLWKHSAAVAALSHWLARRVDPGVVPEELFVAGLLHDIGKIVLAPAALAHEEELEVARERLGNLADAEREVLGHAHTEVGAEIARRWRLADLVIMSAGDHHGVCPHENLRAPVAVVSAANCLAWRLRVGVRVEFSGNAVFTDPQAAALGMTPLDIEPLLAECAPVLEGLRALMAVFEGETT